MRQIFFSVCAVVDSVAALRAIPNVVDQFAVSIAVSFANPKSVTNRVNRLGRLNNPYRRVPAFTISRRNEQFRLARPDSERVRANQSPISISTSNAPGSSNMPVSLAFGSQQVFPNMTFIANSCKSCMKNSIVPSCSDVTDEK